MIERKYDQRQLGEGFIRDSIDDCWEPWMKIADEIMRGQNRSQYQGADWNQICLDNECDVRTQERLSASCYQSGGWWRRWLRQ